MNCQCCPYIETSQLICRANQLAGFYMRATLAFNGLNKQLVYFVQNKKQELDFLILAFLFISIVYMYTNNI